MSSNDYIGIIKRGGYYYGFWLDADQSTPLLKDFNYTNAKFKVKTIEEAITTGQSYETEYGIWFLNIKVKK